MPAKKMVPQESCTGSPKQKATKGLIVGLAMPKDHPPTATTCDGGQVNGDPGTPSIQQHDSSKSRWLWLQNSTSDICTTDHQHESTIGPGRPDGSGYACGLWIHPMSVGAVDLVTFQLECNG